MITTGVTGGSWRASITPWGAVRPWDDARCLEWYVAAEDRWHRPAEEPTVRQHRIDGSPVTETRVRVPNGDVVQRIYSVVDAGGLTVVEVENESTLPVAIAFDGCSLVTERPVADIPIEGIELAEDAVVLPLGHRARLRVAVRHGDEGPSMLPPSLPTATRVARGWLQLTERASRLVLPDGESGAALAEAVTARRCELALGAIPRASDDPAGYAIALGELVRMGERPEHWIPELVAAVGALGPTPGWEADVALDATARVLVVAGERRAQRDLDRIVSERPSGERPRHPPDGAALIPWVETRLACAGALLPDGFPRDWLGSSIEAYGVPTGPASTVSFAVRWHGARPAVLWEQGGDTVELSAPVVAPGWATVEPNGEALWPEPLPARPPEPGSFS